jgi:hypothetical protein
MEDKTKLRLTAAEMSSLWTQYINDTLAVCVSSYFLETATDEEVRPIIKGTLDVAKKNVSFLQELFKNEEFPVPHGFTEKDVNLRGPKLFSDPFMLMYLRRMSIIVMEGSSTAIGLVTRPDVADFHKGVLDRAVELQGKTRDLLLKQGMYVKSPYISVPDQVDFVEKQNFLTGFFGKRRSVTSVEITHLFLNTQTNVIGKALITGFAQTAQKEDVKKFLIKGIDLSQKYIETFSQYLIKENLPSPMTWDESVLDTTDQVFSDKLMMYHVSAMIAAGIVNFAMALAASSRRDLGAKYASFIPEITMYAEEGAKIMIKHGWMEEPPQADDREQLIKN